MNQIFWMPVLMFAGLLLFAFGLAGIYEKVIYVSFAIFLVLAGAGCIITAWILFELDEAKKREPKFTYRGIGKDAKKIF
ncbi:hypothetical protein IID26_02050 [Patescibacteria group bacterium]|nr:hypothetical protein [Patescibacteria group bacterium]